jgi:hypothetical protein
MDFIDSGQLLTDLKDFYIWIKDREGFLETIPRPTMSK